MILLPEAKTLFGILSIAVGAIGDVVYIRSIVRGKTRPHTFTWMIWTVMLGVVFCGQLASGAGPGAWLTGYNTFANAVIVYLASRKKGQMSTRGDWIALLVAASGIPLWLLVQDPLWSVCLETAIGIVIYYPTVRKSYHDPYSENAVAYLFFILPVMVELLAMQNYSATILIYPVSSIFITAAFIALLLWRRRVLAR